MTKNKSQVSRGADGLQLTLELALKVPLIESGSQSLTAAYALIPRQIFPLLSRFLLRHDLSFRLASLPAGRFAEKYLLWLGRGEQSPELIPDFILAYIKNLPFCHLFQGFTSPGKESLFLCEYGFKHPLALAELVAETTEIGLYLGFAQDRSCNSIIRPLPEFCPESSVLQYEVDFPLQQFDAIVQMKPGKLSLPLRFIDYKPSSSEFAPVLFLEGKEISWLKELLYRLPGPLFSEIEWAGDSESLFLFFNNSVGISFFPFGQPFRKLTPNLLIAADKDMIPHLEAEQLHELFQVESDQYTFIAGTWRRDLPASIKAPLHQLLTVANEVKLEFKSDSDLDGFFWEDPVIEATEDTLSQVIEPSKSPGDMPVIPVLEQLASGERMPEECGRDALLVERKLYDYGILLRQQGDFLGAATCFSLARKNLDAADCYAEAARALAREQIVIS